jgi:flagellin
MESDTSRKILQHNLGENEIKEIQAQEQAITSPAYNVEISPSAYLKANQVKGQNDGLQPTTSQSSPEDSTYNIASEKDKVDIVDCLKSDWLEQAEGVVKARYGLSGDGSALKIVLDEGAVPYLAAINYNYDSSGKAASQTLHIAVQTATPANLPNGGSTPMFDDRIITHEMVHVVMGRSMNFASLPTWFKEGTAEFIHGADERVAKNLADNGGGVKGAIAIQNALGNGMDDTWVNDSLHYSAAYTAVRYLHEQIKATGNSDGIKALLSYLQNNPTDTFDQALSHVTKYRSTQNFVADFATYGNGAALIHNMDESGELKAAQMGGDTGAIGGEAVDDGPVLTATSVIPDIDAPTDTPLKKIRIVWPADSDGETLTNNKETLVEMADK